jgi:hypothetical protein
MASNEETNRAPVLILARHGKRGYLIEVAGAEPPQVYPCLSEEDIGGAIVEILNDPDRETVQFTAPEPAPSRAGPRKGAQLEEVEYDDDDDDDADGYHPPGWSASDELAMNLFGALTDKARKISNWRNKG